MANRIRGECEVEIGGERFRLFASFEALANIEDRLGIPISRIGERLSDPKIRDLGVILECLSDGKIDAEVRARAPADIGAASRAIIEAFNSLGWGDDASGNG